METGNTHGSDPHNAHDQQKSQLTPARKAAINALAIVGFVVLVVLGIMLAIYSSRFVPQAVNQISNGSQTGTTTAPLAVVSTTTTTLYIPPAQSTTTAMTAPVSSPITSTVSTTKTSATSEAPAQPRLYGLPNLTTTIIATGYLANGTTDSFVPAQTIPAGSRAAVRFSIANTGTNVTGAWHFSAGIPTQNGYVFNSPVEQSMGPGDHIVFTLGFDQANIGSNQPIVVTADPAGQVNESTKADNSRTATITVIPS